MNCQRNINSTLPTLLPHKFSYIVAIVAILGHNHFESPNIQCIVLNTVAASRNNLFSGNTNREKKGNCRAGLTLTECSRECVTMSVKTAEKPPVGAEEEMGETLERINIEETIKINPI
jgi:hypothetical protein